jgi:hypothetical protein
MRWLRRPFSLNVVLVGFWSYIQSA